MLALIGGSGLNALPGSEPEALFSRETPFGPASAAVERMNLHGEPVLFLSRHGRPHAIPPHAINYRANIWALQTSGASRILAVAAVGGIAEGLDEGRIAVPDQLIDYTWGRDHTYSDGHSRPLDHVDFTEPYDAGLRRAVLRAATDAGVAVTDGGCYAATQGPRLETAAEIRRLARDGADMVGMTGMPEAALARELEMPYACCAVVANRAAGLGADDITMEQIHAALAAGMRDVERLLASLVPALAG